MAAFPMGVWLVLVIITSRYYGIASVTTNVPSTVYIGKLLVYLPADVKPVTILPSYSV